MRRYLAGFLAVVSCATGLLALGSTNSYASDPGYVLVNPSTTGIDTHGLDVRVLNTSAYRSRIAPIAQAVVADMRRAGLDVRWVGSQRDPGTGITIKVASSYCTGGRVANTWPRMGMGSDSRFYQTGGTVEICTQTAMIGGWLLAASVRHEMGHAVGLGHTTSHLGGRTQTMYPYASPTQTTFGPGDWNGLRQLAARTRAATVRQAPIGQTESIRMVNGSIVVSGWAVQRYSPWGRTTIYVYDNNRLIYRVATNVFRADVTRTYGRGPVSHGFQYKLTPVSGSNSVCIQAANGGTARANFGCTTIVGS